MHDKTVNKVAAAAHGATRADSVAPRALRRYLSLDDFEPTARRRLPKFLYGYIAGGAETDAAVPTTAAPSMNTDLSRACSTTSQRASRAPSCSAKPTPRRSVSRRWVRPLSAPIAATSCSRARGGQHERTDGAERLLPDHPGRCAARKPGGLVSGLSAWRCCAHRTAGRPGRRRRLRHVRRHRRRAGVAEPREQYPQRISGPACDHPARRLGYPHPSALAVRHLGAHAGEARHAAFREHGCAARAARAFQKPDAQHRQARSARMEARRADPPPVEGQAGGQRPDRARRRAHRAGKRASTASSFPITAAASSTIPSHRCGRCPRSRRKPTA